MCDGKSPRDKDLEEIMKTKVNVAYAHDEFQSAILDAVSAGNLLPAEAAKFAMTIQLMALLSLNLAKLDAEFPGVDVTPH